MSNMVESITVKTPAHTAYGQWSKLQNLAEFMDGVRDVEKLPNGISHWTIDVGGIVREFDAEILACESARRVVWTSLDGPKHSGSVEFEPIDTNATRVTAQIDVKPEGFMENLADKLGVLNIRIRHDLELFKDYMEHPL